MTFDEYKNEYGNKDHILIRMTDSFPYFKEKYIIENGKERIATNYHLADGMFSCYINFEWHGVSAELTVIPKFELCGKYPCPIFITNIGEKPFDVRIDWVSRTGKARPGEVLGIYPRELADATLEIFEKEAIQWSMSGEKEITQEEMIRLLGG